MRPQWYSIDEKQLPFTDMVRIVAFDIAEKTVARSSTVPLTPSHFCYEGISPEAKGVL